MIEFAANLLNSMLPLNAAIGMMALCSRQETLMLINLPKSPQLMTVQMEPDEVADRGLELMVGEAYRIKIDAGFWISDASLRGDRSHGHAKALRAYSRSCVTAC